MNMPVFPENFSYWLAKPCNVDVDIPPRTKTRWWQVSTWTCTMRWCPIVL